MSLLMRVKFSFVSLVCVVVICLVGLCCRVGDVETMNDS